MISVFWGFVGFLVGLLVTSVFSPPLRKVPTVPNPLEQEPLHTDSGCVSFTSEEVPCTESATSMNVLAVKHK
jgi:hypothetical protein